jgi:hypothetical protein
MKAAYRSTRRQEGDAHLQALSRVTQDERFIADFSAKNGDKSEQA